MRIDVVTLFPGIVETPIRESILGRAQVKGSVTINVVNLRDYAEGRHRVTDDTPFGGGGGMILKPEPLVRAVEALRSARAKVILLDPQGIPFTQAHARRLASEQHLILLCGRYEGVDERVRELVVDEEISIGDYVLTGGELPALVVIDATVRLIPGVLGNEGASANDSFHDGLLEGPQYTRPEEFRGKRVPEILLSGNHQKIREWRRRAMLWRTFTRRPELLDTADLTPEEQKLVEGFRRGAIPPDLDDSDT
jgi:tRNA (guanine37-N1)-methyltransferase